MNECRGDDNGNVNASQITASPDFLISIGARGDYVRQIQNCLNDTSNAGLNSDGIFGPLTQVAVINYQRANGLNPDGIVGPITWEHLVSRCAGASITPASEIAAVVEPTQIIDYSAFNLEYVPNFVTTGSSETKLIQESVDVVETVFANKASKVNEENVLPQSSAAPQINMSNLLMYCLLRQMKK
ncbi:MAG: peptidoglycan-binding protein [Defluviitaleaceae bacterium]|nr:peptidoglycan-binding protein [Defluviitaleaceae bacterium]